ncbi:MAG: hypothetical protein NTZ16_15985, partial [Verrucomicrobia bacterium]|nr:hypothetical protein [Verrucomicrobiota bacterium]
IFSIILNATKAKAKRKAWDVISARCVDRELRKIVSVNNDNSVSVQWAWRVVCEFNYEGRHYRATPKIHWSDAGQSESPFWSEEKAKLFLEKSIFLSGECKLRVNPTDPLETELVR